jgi:DNA-binding NarL/FixJ family response regulator
LIEAQGLELESFATVVELLESPPPRARMSAVVLALEKSGGSPAGQIEIVDQRLPGVPVMLVCRELPRWMVRRALARGAAGLVHEHEAATALGPCLRAVLAGQTCVPSHHRGQIEPPVLSAREKQVLSLVVMGYMNSQIAQQLFLAESTVKSHLSSAFGKLGVRSRNEAVELIVDPDHGLGTGILGLGGEPLLPASAV